jgi:hypothetical protein
LVTLLALQCFYRLVKFNKIKTRTMIYHLNLNHYSIGLTSLCSWGISYFANNTPFGSLAAWKAKRVVSNLLRQFEKDQGGVRGKTRQAVKLAMLQWNQRNDGAIDQVMEKLRHNH